MSELLRRDTNNYLSLSPDATRLFGALIAQIAFPGDVVILTGDLGAGKTCLVGGACAELGDSRPATSPTFGIMSIHDKGRLPLYHMDLYRLDDSRALEDTGVFDVIDADGLCMIEWGERFAEVLSDERLEVHITLDTSKESDHARSIVIRGLGERGAAMAWRLDERARAMGL